VRLGELHLLYYAALPAAILCGVEVCTLKVHTNPE
jgi:hypothetical protein